MKNPLKKNLIRTQEEKEHGETGEMFAAEELPIKPVKKKKRK